MGDMPGPVAPGHAKAQVVGPVVVVLVLCVLVVGAIAFVNWSALGIDIGPTCIVGVTGTAATVTVKGWSADQACSAMRAGAQAVTYTYSGNVTNPVVCQYTIRGQQFTVQDQGLIKLVGGALCLLLERYQASPSSSPPVIGASG